MKLISISDYLKYLQVRKYSERTISDYKRDLETFEMFMDSHKLTTISLTENDIVEYKQYLHSPTRNTLKGNGLANTGERSINRMLSVLKSYLNFLIDSGVQLKVRPSIIKQTRLNNIVSELPTLEEIQLVINNIKKFESNDKRVALRNYAVFMLLFNVGLLISELIALNKGDYDRQGHMLTIDSGNRRSRLSSDACQALNEYLDLENNNSRAIFVPYRGRNTVDQKEARISPDYIQMKFKEYRTHLGITSKVSASTFRQAYLAYIVESSVHNIEPITKLYSHSDLKVSQYVHPDEKRQTPF